MKYKCKGLAVPEDGMTLTFERDQALLREDMELTYEHPLMQSIFETVQRRHVW